VTLVVTCGWDVQRVLAMDMECFLLLVESLDRVQSRESLDRACTMRTAQHGDEKAFKSLVNSLKQRIANRRQDSEERVEVLTDHQRLKSDLKAGFFNPKGMASKTI